MEQNNMQQKKGAHANLASAQLAFQSGTLVGDHTDGSSGKVWQVMSKVVGKVNPGTACGSHWLKNLTTDDVGLLTSVSPIDNTIIGQVEQTTTAQLNHVISVAHNAFLQWRNVPAPKRGELVRLIGDKLREHKADLGWLVSLEMGKSKADRGTG